MSCQPRLGRELCGGMPSQATGAYLRMEMEKGAVGRASSGARPESSAATAGGMEPKRSTSNFLKPGIRVLSQRVKHSTRPNSTSPPAALHAMCATARRAAGAACAAACTHREARRPCGTRGPDWYTASPLNQGAAQALGGSHRSQAALSGQANPDGRQPCHRSRLAPSALLSASRSVKLQRPPSREYCVTQSRRTSPSG